MARQLIIIGILFIVAGVTFQVGKRFGVGQLPGDFLWQKGNFSFYFPLTSSVLISLVLSLVLFFLRYFR